MFDINSGIISALTNTLAGYSYKIYLKCSTIDTIDLPSNPVTII
jgi:hypothetical protein